MNDAPETLFRMRRVDSCDPLLLRAAEESGFGGPTNDTANTVAQLGRSLGVNTSEIKFDPDNTTIIEVANLMRFLDAIRKTRQHEGRIDQIDAVINQIVDGTAKFTRTNPQSIRKIIVDNSRLNRVEADETAEAILSAPNCEGFDEVKDFGLKNEGVNNFLAEVFGKDKLIEYRALRFVRLPGYLVSFSKTSDEILEKHAKLAKEFGLEEIGTTSFYLFPDLESYLVGEAILENEPAEIQHTFRNRAMSADIDLLEPIIVADHSIEDPENFDYLAELDVSTKTKRQLYILGSLAHEVGHCIILSRDYDLEAYKTACSADNDQTGRVAATKYSGEYYEKNFRQPNNINDTNFLVEDFCETIRLYTTSPDYLIKNFPSRFHFVREKYPWIKPRN